MLASLVFASVVAALLPEVGFAQRTASLGTTGTGGLIALATSVDEQRQQVTVIDPATRVLGVYHIDLSTGEVTLK